MVADFKKILQTLEKREFAPVYLIDGEEPFYIDMLTEYFEDKILQPAERDFNLMVLYGKDVEWADVVNACRRFPMFAERQVVILKDAAQMRSINELAGYLENPSPTTVFLIEHRFKKADGRGKLVKFAKEKGYYFTSDKIKEEQVPGWIQAYSKDTGFAVGERESQILATFLGNDLQKIANEIAKVRINVPDEPALTTDMIQKYIGISREYNVFEFPETLTNADRDKMYRMLAYFIANPKSSPMPLLIGSFYSHFSKLYQACFLIGRPEKDAAAAIGTYPNRARQLISTAQRFSVHKIEACLLLLGVYSTKAVGIGSNTDDRELLKEMIGKMEIALS